MSAIDLSPRGARWRFSLENWYVDVLPPDETVLLIYLASVALVGVPIARVTADLYRPDGRIIHGDARAGAVEGGLDYLHLGSATIEGDRLTFKTAGLSGDPRYYPRHAATWLDGRVSDRDDWMTVPSGVTLGQLTIFVDTEVGDIEGLRPVALRRLLVRLSRNPHETKWRAPCVVEDEVGVAVHEVATWNA